MDLVLNACSCAAMISAQYCLLAQPFPAIGKISQYQLFQLSVSGTSHAGSCFAMAFLLLDLFPMSAAVLVFSQWLIFGFHLTDVLLDALDFIQTVALPLTKSLPSSFQLVYSL